MTVGSRSREARRYVDRDAVVWGPGDAVEVPFTSAGEPSRMKIRGERECGECGTRWSYYETGSVGCPACGSLRSVGRDDERRVHTDMPAELDLTPIRAAVDDAPVAELAERAADVCREYIRRRGFVSGGDLRDLDDTYVAALECRHAARAADRMRSLTEAEELYVLALLRGADRGERPPTDAVPASLRSARGLAAADAVDDYRRDLRTWAEDGTLATDERAALGALGDHAKRLRMLDGEVAPEKATSLLAAARELATAVRDGDETALARAEDRLERLV